MIGRLLWTFGPVLVALLFIRWGMGISTPRADQRALWRATGWIERLGTRFDAWTSRLKVRLFDRFEIDRLCWEGLKRRYARGEFYGDRAN